MAAPFQNISVAVSADIANLKAGLAQASQATRKFGDQAAQTASKAGSSITGIGTQAQKTGGLWSRATSGISAGAVAMGTAVGLSVQQIGSRLVQMGADALQSAAQFQVSMLNVQSLGGESTASIKHLSDAVLDMSTKLPQSANTLAEGLYDIESSGFNGAGALDVLDASAKAASAGLTNTATSARAITAVLNSYGLAGTEAQHVGDILFQTVNSGVVSFEELAGSVGDFVPMAAAMGISLEQATGALATMTLAGIPAAESATSLSRVMQSFIKPSDAMGEAMSRLGITLDDLKDPAFGLSGAMKAIAKDTNGSGSALQALFPDVRAFRGALALTANEGKTYSRVMHSQADASKDAGAMTRALTEQMKSLTYQWNVFKNRVGALSIRAFTKAFPLVQDAARKLGDALSTLGDHLAPAWRNLQDAGADLVNIVKDLWAGIEPVGKAMAMAFGAAVVGSITVLASALSSLTGFVSRYGDALKIIGTLMATLFVTNRIQSVAESFALMAMYAKDAAVSAAAPLTRIGAAARTSADSVGVLRTGLKGVRAAGPAVALALITTGLTSLSKAGSKADASVKKITDKATGKGFEGLRVAINDSAAAGRRAAATLNSYGNQANRVMHGILQSFSPAKDTIAEANAEYDKQLSLNHRLVAQQDRLDGTVFRLMSTYGLTRKQVEGLIDSDKELNLTTATSKEVNESARSTIDKLAKSTGRSKREVVGLLKAMSPEEAKAFSDEMDKAGQAVGDAISKYGDLTSIKGLAFNEDLTVSAKQLQWNIGAIKSFYEQRLTGARQFSSDMTTAIAKGYDPSAIMKLASAGPEQAGPILRSLVEGYSGDMVNLFNSANEQMAKISVAAAEKARAMYRATHLATDDLTKDLPRYQQIVDMAAAGMKSPEIALRMKLPASEFNKILDNFGSSMAQLQESADKKPVKPKIDKMSFDDSVTALNVRLHQFTTGRYSTKVLLDTTRAAQDAGALEAEFKHLTRRREAQVRANATPEQLAETDDALTAVAKLREAHIKGIPIDDKYVASVFDEVARSRPSLMQALANNTEWTKSVLNDVANPGGKARKAWIEAEARTAWAAAQLDAVTKQTRTAIITAMITPGPSGQWQSTPGQWAKGGIQEYAAGGISAFAGGGITRRQIIKFGEPETGGEAFVPRLGITSVRAKKILDVAAKWHGLSVVPAGQLRGGGGSAAPVFQMGDMYVDARNSGSPAEVGRAIDKAMTQWVRRNPRELVASIGGHEARMGHGRAR